MDYTDGLDAAAGYMQSTLKLMEQSRVSPHPRNYELFYNYVASRLPDLQWMMGRLMEAGQLTDTACALLYDQFVTKDDGLGDARRKAREALAQAAEQIASANEGATQYGQALEDFSGRLGAVSDEGDLHATLDVIFAETRTMARVNRQLEQRLQSSVREIAQLRQNLEETKKEASTDSLTGIANRKVFDVALRRATTLAQQQSGFLSLLVIDIDHFKAFNDKHGHLLGDQVLKLVARCITECIKGQDIAARYGGEEFCVILPQTRLHQAAQVAEQIRRHVASRKITNRRTGETLGSITLSIGVAQYALGEDDVDFLKNADEAMYLAKRSGRNRVATQEDVAKASA